jgi:site-specific recombinase XerD
MKNNQRFSLYQWPNKQKEKEGQQPVYIRIKVDSQVATIATRFYIKPTHWDKKSGRLKSNAPSSQQVNAFIDRTCNLIQQDFLNCVARGEMVTAQELKNNFLGIDDKPQERTLLEAVTYHNDKFLELVNSGQMVHSTWKKYNTTKNKIVEFLKKRYKRKDIPLSEIKYSFVTDFEHFLFTDQKLQTNTVYKSIKQLKKIMRVCVDNDWLELNPFDRFKCGYKSPDRIVLSQSEIDALINKQFTVPRLAEIRDVFVFCCYTGFAYSEVHKFKFDDVIIGIDGERWITTYRKKTGERESVPLLPIAFEIVQRYKEHPLCIKTGKLLPVKSNQVYNSYLKEVAALCNIKKHLTTHIARHTFATTIALSNGVPIETVSKMLGHARVTTTQIYAKVLDLKTSQDMQTLKAKLNPKKEERKLNTM